MSFSISPSTPFASINWDNFENRPPINESMPFCDDKYTGSDSKCCMDDYALESVTRVAHKNNLWNTPEVQFLEKSPCVNLAELDSLADQIDEMIPETEQNTTPPTEAKLCLPIALFEQLKKFVCLE
jgi:hypothetical protein